jgi:uncharacterized coiled-coil protein SlyX
MTNDDGPELSAEDRQKLAVIRADLDREVAAVLDPHDTEPMATPRRRGRRVLGAVTAVGIAVIAGVVTVKGGLGVLARAPRILPSYRVDAGASSNRSRPTSRPEAPAAEITAVREIPGTLATSAPPPPAKTQTSTVDTRLPASIADPTSDMQLESRIAHLETEMARLRHVIEGLERMRLREARVGQGKRTAQLPGGVGRRPESHPRVVDASAAHPVERTVVQPSSEGSRPLVAESEDGSGLRDDHRSPAEDGVLEFPTVGASSAAVQPLAEPEVQSQPASGPTSTETRRPSSSETMRAENPPTIVGQPESGAAPRPPLSERWARIKEATAQFAEDTKAAGRQVADSVRRLGENIKEAVGLE